MPYKLLIPGPVDVEDDVLLKMSEPVVPHYGLEFGALYVDTANMLKRIFRTQGSVFLIPGSGSAGTDAAIGNFTRPGQRVVVCANGYFGDRLVEIARAYEAEPIVVNAEWGKAIEPDDVRAAFKAAGGPISALFAVHVETSTGVINPVRELAAIANAYGAGVIVDAITSLGGTELDVDGWGIDLCISASQKALAAPAGYSLLAVSPRGWARMDALPTLHRGWYLDLKAWREFAAEDPPYHPFPVTVPPGNTKALHLQVRKILAQGIEHYIARHAQAAERFRSALPAHGLRQFVTGAAAAPMLTLVALPDGVDQHQVIGQMRERHGLLASGGFGAMANKVLRIGHMGKAASASYVDAALASLGQIIGS